jgi:Icc-related predicted phosphoesterase
MTRDYFLSLHPNLFYIYGNHDYYGRQTIDWDQAETHVKEVVVDDVKIRGATLWTEMTDNGDWLHYTRNLADNSYIRKMTLESYQKVHKAHKKWLFESDADVLIMHHSPSYKSIAPRFIGDDCNMFFATELSNIILDMKKPPKLIIHGHMHNKSDYMIGDTRVICHPRGYPDENPWFKNYEPLILEV